MRDYELTYIIHPEVEEPDLTDILDRVRSLISNNGGEIVNETSWGKRRLAYPIQNMREGLYMFLELKLPAQAILEIEHALKLTEPVMRHLIVRVEE
jgi:small subunit ribosomal protein S6